MAYYVDRVVICDAYTEPEAHYQLLAGGKSKRIAERRPSMRYLASARDTRGGIAGVVGREAGLFEDMAASEEQLNEVVNQLRADVREWRTGEGRWAGSAYGGTALVTRRLLEWWFERDEERSAEARRFFFCQREAVEAVIYLYEVQNRRRMPETGDLVRYALKLATGTGKTLIMAMLITWATLHRRKVSGSSLTANFLVLVPNLTVRDRVSGLPRGDGLDPAGSQNLYDAFDMVPPEYKSEFHPNIMIRNWQAISLENRRTDWIPDEFAEEGRFVPASVLWAMRRRARQDPNGAVRRMLGGWRDLLIINDEAHHVYGEKRGRKGEEAQYIKWSKILERIGKVARIGAVIDLSATPWYGSGSPRPEGTLFEWLISDFSVYDAFESGLVKVVRLPDPEGEGVHQYLDLWDEVKGARTKEEYLSACKGAIASIYADWKDDYINWQGQFENMRPGPAPALLVVADRAQRAEWLFEHLSRDFELLGNPADEDPSSWVTIRVDSDIFDAEKGKEATLRGMVNTIGVPGKPGEKVRCIISVNMLSEGWDVKSVTHILGLRAFGSPLLTEQVVGRGLRRTNYDVLNQPLEERPEGYEETVDAFGIPFIGFPVQKKRKRPPTGKWGQELVWIDLDPAKAEKYRVSIPNVRSWAVGLTQPLVQVINIRELPGLVVNPKETPPEVRVRPVIGGQPESIMTLEQFRAEYPLLRSKMIFARELFEATNPGSAEALGIGPTFEELLEFASAYVDLKVTAVGASEPRDIGIYYWSQRALGILETAIRGAQVGTASVPILGDPPFLDTANYKRSQWTGIVADGRKTPTTGVPCHTDLERHFVKFLDGAKDVLRYFKNERFGFSVTYYENNRPRQYYPDFIVVAHDASKHEVTWLVETKGEIRANTAIKRSAAELLCEKMSTTQYGAWRHLFVQQRPFEQALASGGVKSFGALGHALVRTLPSRQLRLIAQDDPRVLVERFKALLPLYSLKVAAGYFGSGQAVEPEGWVDASSVGKLDDTMFVAQAVGRSMEPTIFDGEYCVFRANPVGSREGKIVLVQHYGPADPETGGSYTVKKYHSEKVSAEEGDWQHLRITLQPESPEFEPIVLTPEAEHDVRVIAEFVAALGRS
jgi:type III restriction enzyme